MTVRSIATLVFTVVLASFVPRIGYAQTTPVFKSPEAREALRDYDVAVKKLNDLYSRARNGLSTKYAEEASKLRDTFVAELKEAQNAATRDSDLDEAIKLRNAISEYEKAKLSPPPQVNERPTTPEANAKIRELEAQVQNLEKQLAAIQSKQKSPYTVLAGGWIRDYKQVRYVLKPDQTMFQLSPEGRQVAEFTGKWFIHGQSVYFVYPNPNDTETYQIVNEKLLKSTRPATMVRVQ